MGVTCAPRPFLPLFRGSWLERGSKLIYDMVKHHSAIFARKMCHPDTLAQWQILERIAILRFTVGGQLALELE